MIPNGSNIVNISSYKEKNGNVGVESKESYFKLPYYMDNIYDEKEFSKYVKSIEKQIRRSTEYSSYLGYLRSQGLNSCAILGNIQSDEEHSNVTIEFHHYPFTLYDIVSIVLEKKLKNKENVSSFLVANDVIDLHFKNMVGLVPLCKTVHELVHEGSIFVNLNLAYGYYDKFIELYKDKYDCISDDYINLYNNLVDMSIKQKPYSNSDILEILNMVEEREEENEALEKNKKKANKEDIDEFLLDDEDEEE